MSGYQVKAFENISSALNFYEENKKEVKAILLDLYQPEANYKTTIPAFRAINPNVKIITMSGASMPEDLLTDKIYKVEFFVKKPFQIQDLLEIIDCVLK